MSLLLRLMLFFFFSIVLYLSRTFIVEHHAVATESDEVAPTTTPLGGMSNNNVSSARFRKIKASRLSACSDTFMITDRGHLDESCARISKDHCASRRITAHLEGSLRISKGHCASRRVTAHLEGSLRTNDTTLIRPDFNHRRTKCICQKHGGNSCLLLY